MNGRRLLSPPFRFVILTPIEKPSLSRLSQGPNISVSEDARAAEQAPAAAEFMAGSLSFRALGQMAAVNTTRGNL